MALPKLSLPSNRLILEYAKARQLESRYANTLASVPNSPPIGFLDFVRLFWSTVVTDAPLLENWHIQAMCEHAEAVILGKEFIPGKSLSRLIVNVPPGSTKTTIFSVMLLPWVWTFRPEYKILGVGNKQQLALTAAGLARQIVESDLYQKLYPYIKLCHDSNTKGFFKNTLGGERLAAGILTKITGYHFHCIVVDDGNAANKLTDADFEAVKDAYRALTTRYISLDVARMIIVMQRLHMRDLTGQLTSSGEKEIFSRLVLPMEFDPEIAALTTTGFIDPRRAPGELLDARRWSAQKLNELKHELSILGYTQQYQQLVTPAEGVLFDPQKFAYIGPSEVPPVQGLKLLWAWDLAQSEKASADRTAGVLLGYYPAKQIFYVLNAVAFREAPAQAAETVKRIIGASVQRYGVKITIGVERERGGAGGWIGEFFTAKYPGHSIIEFLPNSSKIGRAQIPAEIFNHGKVLFVNDGNSFIGELVDELTTFPYSQHDDLVDAFCYAINWLRMPHRNSMRIDMPILRRKDYAT